MTCASPANQAYMQTHAAVAEEEQSYILTTGTIRRKTRPPQIDTSDHHHIMHMSPSPRLRVAFNRQTSFLLEPQTHKTREKQQQHHLEHVPNVFKAEATENHSTEMSVDHEHEHEPETPSPKTTHFDLEYTKPGLHRETSGFDDETSQARHFARLISRDESSPQRRRTPQRAEMQSDQQQEGGLDHSSPPTLPLPKRHGSEEPDDDRRGRRRRRIGSEIDHDHDHEMADA
ncbi:hypothetical protein CKM354_001183600 [Cercospora kikuchii]|uniref:Uncharacterized protein n=1 Tax=Cercospora kikuchii TaxID=84275 RepID=A0A9P3CQ88_9PEZI|nr:uncharacterized protein CKM354_001183600 [Cercospora kikuchii]GIZ48789.1 hypothetical protein CKM354_001183600 [Cercospora kikuchii]